MKLEIKDAARQLTEELSELGLALSYTNALDIISRLEGYPDWQTYRKTLDGTASLFSIHLIYLTGFAEKGYWWTKAQKEPWIIGQEGVDYDGPFKTEDEAKEKALLQFPQAAVVPYVAPKDASAGADAAWQTVSLFLRMRIHMPLTPRITKVMQNRAGPEYKAMNDAFEFKPHYAQKDGRILGVSWRSPLKFENFNGISKTAAFSFDARIEVSKPSGTELKTMMKSMRLVTRVTDTWDEPETELISWE